MGIDSHYLQDKNGQKFYPKGHADATYDRNGNKIGDVLETIETNISNAGNEASEAKTIALGKNSAEVFKNVSDMEIWLKDSNNKGKKKVGDNLYIKTKNVPDYWISEVLENADGDGFFYHISELETQKVDLSDYSTTTQVDNKIQTATSNKVDKVDGKGLSTNDLTNDLKSQYDAKYTKPSTGIPLSDLSSGVQSSLSKADSALQSHQDISGKQDKTDNTLTTTNKTVTGAINENKTNIDTLQSNITELPQTAVTHSTSTLQTVEGNGVLRNWARNLITFNLKNINLSGCSSFNVNSDGSLTIISSNKDSYIGNVSDTNTIYTPQKGLLINVSNINRVCFSTRDNVFNKNFITKYNSDKIALQFFRISNGSIVDVSDCSYITIRVGVDDSVLEQLYTDAVMLEEIPDNADLSQYPHPYVPYEGYDVVTQNEDGTQTDTIHVTNDTQPNIPLKTYNGITNILAPSYIDFAYMKNEQAKNLNEITLSSVKKSYPAMETIEGENITLNDTIEASMMLNGWTKNLFDINGEWFKYNTNSTVAVNGNKVTITGIWHCGRAIKVKKNTNYSLSVHCISGNVFRDIAIYNEGLTQKIVEKSLDNDETAHITFNTEDNTIICLLLYSGFEASGTSVYSDIMLEEIPEGADESEYPHSYVPYEYDITTQNADNTKSSTVHVTPDTPTPVLGLKSFDGVTNIIAPSWVDVTVARNKQGRDVLGNMIKKDGYIPVEIINGNYWILDNRSLIISRYVKHNKSSEIYYDWEGMHYKNNYIIQEGDGLHAVLEGVYTEFLIANEVDISQFSGTHKGNIFIDSQDPVFPSSSGCAEDPKDVFKKAVIVHKGHEDCEWISLFSVQDRFGGTYALLVDQSDWNGSHSELCLTYSSAESIENYDFDYMIPLLSNNGNRLYDKITFTQMYLSHAIDISTYSEICVSVYDNFNRIITSASLGWMPIEDLTDILLIENLVLSIQGIQITLWGFDLSKYSKVEVRIKK